MHRWKDVDFISEKDWNDIHIKMADLVEQNNIKYILVDSSQKYYPITPEQREWFNKNISPRLAKVLEKMAFVLPKDLFAQFGLVKTIEDSGYTDRPIKAFDSYDEAYNYLLND
jgi:hypothetical protein